MFEYVEYVIVLTYQPIYLHVFFVYYYSTDKLLTKQKFVDCGTCDFYILLIQSEFSMYQGWRGDLSEVIVLVSCLADMLIRMIVYNLAKS